MLKKGVTSIATIILVATTLVLCVTGIVGITLVKKDEGIISYGTLDSIYAKEAQLKFLVSQGLKLSDAVSLVSDAELIDETHASLSLIKEDVQQAVYRIYVSPPDYTLLLKREGLTPDDISALINSGTNLQEHFYKLKGW